MNWPVRALKLSLKFTLAFLLLQLLGCGVKGDPIPPDKPTEIGRGRPTYKRATKDIKIQRSTPSIDDEDEDKEEENER